MDEKTMMAKAAAAVNERRKALSRVIDHPALAALLLAELRIAEALQAEVELRLAETPPPPRPPGPRRRR